MFEQNDSQEDCSWNLSCSSGDFKQQRTYQPLHIKEHQTSIPILQNSHFKMDHSI